MREIHLSPVDSPHKGPVMQKAFPWRHHVNIMAWEDTNPNKRADNQAGGFSSSFSGCSRKFTGHMWIWRWLSELMVNARAFWCDSTGSKSKIHDKILTQNRNVILLNLIYFLVGVVPGERFLCSCYWDPTPERRVPCCYGIICCSKQ